MALDLLPAALVITLVGYLESIVIAKTYAVRLGYGLRPNQEMVAVGITNLVSGGSGGYPVSGSFSRTAANVEAGARTPGSKVVAALLVLLVLVALTPLLEPMPSAALAAIIIVAVAQLVDVAEIRRAWLLYRRDFIMLALAFVLTLALGVEIGLTIAIALSLIAVGPRGLRSRIADRSAGLPAGAAAVSVEGPLTFANQRGLRKALARIVAARGPGELSDVIVDLGPAPVVDISAVEALDDLVEDYAESGIRVHVAAGGPAVRALVEASGLAERLDGRYHADASAARASLANPGAR